MKHEHASADKFEIPQDAMTSILDEARRDEPGSRAPRVRSLVPESRRVRVLMFSVAALVLAAAIAVPLTRGETPAPTYGSAGVATRSHRLELTVFGAPARGSSGTPIYEKTPSNDTSTTGTGFTSTTKIESNGYVNLTVGLGKVPSAIKRLT